MQVADALQGSDEGVARGVRVETAVLAQAVEQGPTGSECHDNGCDLVSGSRLAQAQELHDVGVPACCTQCAQLRLERARNDVRVVLLEMGPFNSDLCTIREEAGNDLAVGALTKGRLGDDAQMQPEGGRLGRHGIVKRIYAQALAAS